MRPEVLMICILIAAFVLILAALFLRYRNLQMFHRERLAALEKGVTIPIGHALAPWTPRVYLLRGLLWSFAGVALVVSLLGIAASTHRPETAESALMRAKNLSFTYNVPAEEAKEIVEKDRVLRRNGLPSSVALLGLIPVSVGLAYLVFYYIGNRRRMDDDQRNADQSA